MSTRAERLVELAVNSEQTVARGEALLRKQMSPKGALGLPALLEARRWEFLIPDGAFTMHALFDRVLVAQIPAAKGKTFVQGGIIEMPDTTKAYQHDSASRGVLVSAGLGALDNLRSNGVDIGHIIRFSLYAPWKMEIDNVEGHAIHNMVLRAGELVASEDLQEALFRGECKVEYDTERNQHNFVDRDGKRWTPTLPWISDAT